ncbi:MAG: oligoendopeptidase F, partial [Amylibacter sp.]
MFNPLSPAQPDLPRDIREGAANDAFGDLPEWNLDDLYSSTDGPEITEDMDWLGIECASFAADFEGKLADLDAAGLLACILRYEKIQNVMGRVMSFSGLRYYQNTTDP